MLESIDTFGISKGFMFDGHDKFRTKLGGILSIVCLGIMILFISLFGQDFYYRTNPKIISSTNFPENYSYVNMSSISSVIAWRFEDENGGFIDVTGILYPKISYFSFITDETTQTLEKEFEKDINPKLCSEVKNVDEKFANSFNVSEWYCYDFSEDKDFKWGGFWSGSFVAGWDLDIDTCNWNKSECSSKEKVQALTPGPTNRLFFSTMYPELFFSPENLQNPLNYEYKNYFETINTNIVKANTYYFRENMIDDDRGWIFHDLNQKKILTFNELVHDVVFKPDDAYENPQNYENTVIYSSSYYFAKNYLYFHRSFMKIQDLAAVVGGILKTIMFSFTLFTNFYSNLFLYHTLLNQFFIKETNKKSSFKSLENLNVSNLPLNHKIGNKPLSTLNILKSSIKSKFSMRNLCAEKLCICSKKRKDYVSKSKEILKNKMDIKNYFRFHLLFNKLIMYLFEDKKQAQLFNLLAKINVLDNELIETLLDKMSDEQKLERIRYNFDENRFNEVDRKLMALL